MTMDSLTSQFRLSVRVLFDILDTHKRGTISFGDIGTKWNPETTKDLPGDVISCLRAVTPPNGLLTFDAFLRGLEKSLEADRNGGVHPPPKPMKPMSLQHQRPGSTDHYEKTAAEHRMSTDGIYGSIPAERLNQNGRSQSITDLARSERALKLQQQQSEAELYRRAVPKRRDSNRRHTLGHGVDGSMVRRSKMLQQERAVLVQGLQNLDKAREWFNKRLHEVHEKERFGQSEASDQSTDQQQEKLNFERVRIQELNQQLSALIEGRGSLQHMNLARPMQAQSTDQSTMDAELAHAMQLLRAQNKMLTKEVSQKSERISQLEKDKATLLKDMFEMRSRRQPAGPAPIRKYDESTLM